MDIQELLKEKGISRYGLSKSSGIPWATLTDICSGKTHLERCTGATLVKLAAALEMTIDELLKLETPKEHKKNGKPEDRRYLESSLPESLDKSLKEYLQGEAEGVSYLDCLWDELYGSINSNFWGGRITQEQADYLREVYLFGEKGESDD
ncbi:MAG: helix-turn-helix transcriptional regulator [Lachnospiraceae bacterium]|nr:helix-turn-helix transcriptional regulator [Lachnospiraceae bacterium]